MNIKQVETELANICRQHDIHVYDAARYHARHRLKIAYKMWVDAETCFNRQSDQIMALMIKEKELTLKLEKLQPNTHEWNICKQQINNIINTDVNINILQMKKAQQDLKHAQDAVLDQNLNKMLSETFRDGYTHELWYGIEPHLPIGIRPRTKVCSS